MTVTRLADPGAVAVGEGAAWVTDFWRGSISRVDIHTGRVVAAIGLTLPRPVLPGDRAFLPSSVAAGERAVWVSTARGWIARIDPSANRVTAMIALPPEATGSVVAGLGGVWVAENVLGLYRIDPVTYRISKVVIAGPRASRLGVDQPLVGAGTIWVEGGWAASTPGLGTPYTSTDRGGLAEVAADTRRVIATVAIPPGPSDVAYGGGGLWISSRTRPIVQRLNSRSRQIVQTIHIQAPGALLALTPGALWLSSKTGIVNRIDLLYHANTARLFPAAARGRVRHPVGRSRSFPNAPPSQSVGWREGGGTPCPLASPNPYLPARAGCVSVQRADVDGDGRPDLILLFEHRGSFTLEVVRGSGGTLTAHIPQPDPLQPPTILLVRNVNDRPGAEIFIHETHLSSGELAGVYAFDGHQLRRADGFWYSGDSAQQYGFTCHRGDPATIVQHQFLLDGPSISGPWQDTETTYTWVGAALRQTATSRTERYGFPPKRLTAAEC